MLKNEREIYMKRSLCCFCSVLVINFCSCDSNIVKDNESVVITPTETVINTNIKTNNSDIKMKKYGNARFKYFVDYPESWLLNPESTNGDGVYLEDVGVTADLRIYGGNLIDNLQKIDPEAAKKEGKSVLNDKTNEGKELVIVEGADNDKMLFHGIAYSKDIHVNFYALVSKEYYEKNRDNFYYIAKSIVIKEE